MSKRESRWGGGPGTTKIKLNTTTKHHNIDITSTSFSSTYHSSFDTLYFHPYNRLTKVFSFSQSPPVNIPGPLSLSFFAIYLLPEPFRPQEIKSDFKSNFKSLEWKKPMMKYHVTTLGKYFYPSKKVEPPLPRLFFFPLP